MEVLKLKKGNISIVFTADQKADYYVTASGDVVRVNMNYALHEIDLLFRAGKKGDFVVHLNAINKAAVERYIKGESKWVNRNVKPLNQNALFTMLRNKGIV